MSSDSSKKCDMSESYIYLLSVGPSTLPPHFNNAQDGLCAILFKVFRNNQCVILTVAEHAFGGMSAVHVYVYMYRAAFCSALL